MLLLSHWSKNPCQLPGLGYASPWERSQWSSWCRSFIHLFSTHVGAHPWPYGGDFPPMWWVAALWWLSTLQISSNHRSWLWLSSGFTAAFLYHFPVYTGSLLSGYDCGILDLARKWGEKSVVCCVGEPKVSLQGLKKKGAINKKHLITLGRAYSRGWSLLSRQSFWKYHYSWE